MYFRQYKLITLLFLLIIIMPLSCIRQAMVSSSKTTGAARGCRGCHQVKTGRNHDFSCIICHNGDNQTSDQRQAHAEVVANPSQPDTMKICGRCHAGIVAAVAKSTHLTLRKAVNIVRRSFADDTPDPTVSSLLQIPVHSSPQTPLELADDLLRRRCLRCHLYYSGDPYPATTHGTGCAACHIAYENGKPLSHRFIRPTDRQCLSCHYGNFVGADYYGRFEHDFNWEYRTPFASDDDDDSAARPYGIRFQQLTPDIHQRRGMACIDCHSGAELMGNGPKITCKVCHLYQTDKPHPGNLQFINNKLWLNTVDGKRLPVPQAVNPAHRYNNVASCQVCHAQWSFNDQGIYLLRLDNDDFDEWTALTRQGDFEVEKSLEAALFTDDDTDSASMTDKISGNKMDGIWLKTYLLRRWEPVEICQDDKGILRVCRNIMDLHLSYVDEAGKVVIDNATAAPVSFPSPYTPHTTGKAGAFFKQRLRPSSSHVHSPVHNR